MRDTIGKKADVMETAILLALHAAGHSKKLRKGERGKNGLDREYIDMAAFCPRADIFPKECYTFDAASSERLYSSSMDDLVVDPVQAIGQRLETMMLCEDGSLKWSAILPMPKPRGIASITNRPHKWFSYHFRQIARDGRQMDYIKKPLCLADGRVVKLKPLGWNGYRPEDEALETESQLALTLSIFEDSHRSGAFMATVKESVELRFPVGQEAYKDFFKLRDGPNETPTGRKNPIIHWCAKHIRETKSGPAEIERHKRGTETLIVGPMTLTIAPTEGYSPFKMERNAGRT